MIQLGSAHEPGKSPADDDSFDPFAGGPIEQVLPTTEAQREVWLGDQLGTEASLAYNEACTLEFDGPLDVSALSLALDRLVARHESLRASFSADGTQLLVGAAGPLVLQPVDLSGLDAATRAHRVAQASAQAVTEPFVLTQGPLFRARLMRLAHDRHLLVLSAHHAVCDGWSWGVLQADLGALYAEALGTGPSPEAAPRWADYVAWEAAESASPERAQHIDFWLRQFKGGEPPALELPTDHPRPAVRGFGAGRIDHVLDAGLVASLRSLASSQGASLYAALFGGFASLLHRLTEQDDLVIGIAAAGQLASDMPRLVGHCVNTLPLRVAVDGAQPFDALVRQGAAQLLDAFEHQTVTYGALLQKMLLQRDASRMPLVSVLFNVDTDLDTRPSAFAGLAVRLRSIPRAFENFELFMNMTPESGGLRMELQYKDALFDEASVGRWLRCYEALLRSAVATPTQPIASLDGLGDAAWAELLPLQPEPQALPQPALMHAGFVASAQGHAHRSALLDAGKRHDYRSIDQRSNQLAHRLRARGIGRGERVGLCLERGVDMLVALLAVLKSGAAYVPLDPGFPKARLDYYARDAQLGLLITHSRVEVAPRDWRDDAGAQAQDRVLCLDQDDAWQAESTEPLPAGPLDAGPADMAYLIYTSGSTGQPKGVAVPHAAVANFLAGMRELLAIDAQDRLAAVTTLSFDISVLELMLPLSVGAEVVLVDRATAMDGQALAALLEAADATVMQATPGSWRLLLDSEWTGGPRFKALIGGESLPRDLALQLLPRCGELWNLYGPTETTVWSSAWKVDASMLDAQGVSIGQPIANTRIWVLDAQGRPCPVGVPGEICIGGSGVAIGYLGRDELTAERFVPDALPGPRMPLPDGLQPRLYRTGDRGRYRNDGLLEHLGRLDDQVKVRGFRIELGEIEAACQALPAVASAVVVTREEGEGDLRLVAYLVASGAEQPTQAQVNDALRDRLPQYMLPQHVVWLDAIPRLPNGKVDRRALPAPQREAAAHAQAPGAEPRDERERLVLRTMEQVLSLPGLGIRDDFFALGGHSLLAARLVSALGRELGVRVPLRLLFEAPTAEGLAAAIARIDAGADAASGPSATPDALRAQPHRRGAPLTPMQERMLFLESLHPGRPVFNTPSAFRIDGPLDERALAAALQEVVRRQPALRTAFGRDARTGQSAARIESAVDVQLPLVDLREFPADQREAELVERLQELADRPIDLLRAPLFHATLVRIDVEDHVLVFVAHHLVWDGWSLDLLVQELSAIYEARLKGRPHGLPELSITHGDYAEWYLQWMDSPAFAPALDFWKQRFARVPATRPLPTDMPRRAGMSGQGGTQWFSLDADLVARLHALAQQHGVTLNMLALAVYLMLLSSAMERRSLVVITPVRGREQPELEPVMGFFNNLLPFAFEVDGERSLGEFLAYVKAEVVEALDHQAVPFERMASEPEFSDRAQGAGLYQALFSYQDARARLPEVGGLALRALPVSQRGATEDLGIWLVEDARGIEGGLTYNADIYRRETGAALRNRYVELLRRVADHPQDRLAELVAPHGSLAATYLQRLTGHASDAMPPLRVPIAHAPTPQPLNAQQRELAQIWAEFLKIEIQDIHPSDNFFDLGGDSLLAMRVMARSEQQMGFRTEPQRYVFETLAQLSSADAAAAPSPQPADAGSGRGLLGRVFSGWGRKDRR